MYQSPAYAGAYYEPTKYDYASGGGRNLSSVKVAPNFAALIYQEPRTPSVGIATAFYEDIPDINSTSAGVDPTSWGSLVISSMYNGHYDWLIMGAH